MKMNDVEKKNLLSDEQVEQVAGGRQKDQEDYNYIAFRIDGLIGMIRPYEEYARPCIMSLLKAADSLRAGDIWTALHCFPGMPAQPPGMDFNTYFTFRLIWLDIQRELYEDDDPEW